MMEDFPAPVAPTPAPAPAVAAPAPAAVTVHQVLQAAAPPAVAAALAPRADEAYTLRLGTIAQRLGFSLQADFVANTLGIEAKTEGAAKLYRESDFDRICERLVTRIRTVQAERKLQPEVA